MKRIMTMVAPAVAVCAMTACQPKNTGTNGTPVMLLDGEQRQYSQSLPLDSANKMLNSYLASTTGNDSNLRALIFDADTLVHYLTDTSRGKISKVKLMFAHNLDYINSGNFGKQAGYRNDALTLIIVGYDSSGNYVYNARNMVYDYCQPCPYNCPNGTAADTLLTP